MKKRILPILTLIMITGMSFAQTHTMIVTVLDTTVQVCYAAGDFNNWNPATDKMTQISESPKMFSLSFEMADTSANKVNYKFLSGPDWKYQQKQADNFVFLDDSITAVVDTFAAVYDTNLAKDVTIDVLVPAEVVDLYLTGSFNNWPGIAAKMDEVDSTESGKEFTLTIHTPDTTTLEYKFIAGPGWPYQQTSTDNFKYTTNHGIEICDEFLIIYNPINAGDITLNITDVPEGTEQVWIVGTFIDWHIEDAIQATKVNDTTYTAVIPFVANIEYKCYSFNDWIYEEAIDAEGNSVPNRTAAFTDGPEFDITVAFWKNLYTSSPTGIKDPISARYKMYTINGTIVVEGVNSNVAIFDLNGRMIQNVRAKGKFTSNNLRTGLYIIRVDNQAQKIVVR